jgi:phosphatidate cytidylyltransferase
MADDTTKSGSGEFDDWLDEKPGPPTDPANPYKDLASDDADEIADWMAFTGGSASETPEPEPEPLAVEPADEAVPNTGEIDVADDSDESVESDGQVVAPLAPVFDPDLEDAETVEIEAVEMGEASDDPDDTGEIELIPIAPYGGYTQDPEPIPRQSRELFDLSESDYLATATTEHSDLAEAIAVASTQDTEQVPIAASIPGMTDTVVGFEDVVAAEGIGRVRARASGDLVARVITGFLLISALGASLIWRPALAIFALVVFVLGAGEFYTSLVRAGHKPIGIFGFIGIIGASVGAYFWGSLAIPVAFIVAVALLLLYYAVVPGKADPLGNLALTITVMVWVGLGAYTMLIVVSDSYRPLVIGVVITVAAMDIAQYFIGRAIGRTPLSPWVSPKKTVEGLVAGIFVAMVIGALLHFVKPFELTSGLALGLTVAVFAPLGDLAMSAAKRSLKLKDMGSVLPGHGGFLDRIDGLLFVIPAAWVVFVWAGIL